MFVNEPPWINDQLKSLIREGQVAHAQCDLVNFRRLRNRVNRLRKSCRTKYYASKVEHLTVCDPRRWWKEVKSLGGMQSATRTEPTSFLKHIDAGRKSSLKNLANIINNTFLAPTDSFTPMAPSWPPDVHIGNSPSVTEYCVFEKLALLNTRQASDPDNVPAWLLEEKILILALVVTDIPTQRIRRHGIQILGNRLTKSNDINKRLRPISLTPILSKLAEEFVVDQHAKPAVLAKVDLRQFGTVPRSSITVALLSMTHTWKDATDGNGATVRVVLFDFKKAFDLIDHHILIRKRHH